ncbi:MAG: hypothetical protein E5V18_15585, partial [Mesorhizobium sp.]
MRNIDVRGKAPMPFASAMDRDTTDDPPAGPLVRLEEAGGASSSVVEQTRSEFQAPRAREEQPSSILSLLFEQGDTAERLIPIDLLSLTQSSPELRAVVQLTPAYQERYQRAVRVQAIWNRLTEQQSGANPSAGLMYSGVIQSLAHNFNCLLSAQKVALVALVEGLDDPEMRNSALEEIGADLAGLPPELQQRLVALAEGLEDAEDCVFVLRGFGTGVAGLAPELQQRLLVLADGIDEPNYRALALSALGAGVTGLTPELQQRLVVLV